MSYLTPAALLARFGAAALADLAWPDGSRPNAEHLAVTISGGNRSSWTDDERAQADQAVATLTAICADTDAVLDDTFRQQYSLPLAGGLSASGLKYGLDLAFDALHKEAVSELVLNRANVARQWLRDVAAGNVDPQAIPTNTSEVLTGVQVEVSDRYESIDLWGY